MTTTAGLKLLLFILVEKLTMEEIYSDKLDPYLGKKGKVANFFAHHPLFLHWHIFKDLELFSRRFEPNLPNSK